MEVMLKLTRIVELQLRVGCEDRREEADCRLVRLPVRHGVGSEVVSVEGKVWIMCLMIDRPGIVAVIE